MTTSIHLKLSELIRKGAALVDGQIQGDYIRHANDAVYCCAQGAAYYALTGTPPGAIIECMLDEKPSVRDALMEVEGADFWVLALITDMNDVEHKTFEEIAAALEAKGL